METLLIITTWVDAPTFKDDILSFSGIVAGGFDGIVDPFKGEKKFPGTLAYITFNTGAVGTGTIFATSDTKAYLNDGDGTETFLIFTPFDYSIVAGKKFISKFYIYSLKRIPRQYDDSQRTAIRQQFNYNNIWF
jgi:hypothetical protein